MGLCARCDDLRRATDHIPLPLAADADLAKRVIESKGSKVAKQIGFLLGFSIFTILITFGHFPRVENHEHHYHLMYNEGTVESVSMFTRFVATPLLFNFKFIVKSLVYKGRTIIIKMPLVRHVMPKRELRDFLRRRAEGGIDFTRRMITSTHGRLSGRQGGESGRSGGMNASLTAE